MKRHGVRFILTVFLFAVLSVSCTHQAEQYSVVDETSSIRYAVKKAVNSITWTKPLEPDALSEDPQGKEKDTFFYPGAGFSVVTGSSSVYPMLENFGSLDVSMMSRTLLTGIHDFLKQLSQKTLAFSSSYFDRPYEGVVILYEASRLPEITGWTIGKPYVDSRAYEVPVMLETATGKCSVRIYLNPEEAALEEVKVQQVMFGTVKSE